MYYINLNYYFGFFKFSKWLTAAILIFEKAFIGKTRDNSNFDYGHIHYSGSFPEIFRFLPFFPFNTLMLLDY